MDKGNVNMKKTLSALQMTHCETPLVVSRRNSEKLDEAVIEAQTNIRNFLDSLKVTDKKKQDIRPYLVEYVKWAAK